MIAQLRSTGWWAGLALAVLVSFAAGYAADWAGVTLLGFAKSPISAIMMAIVLGMLIANAMKLPDSVQPGLKFCASSILRIGIMLLGIRLSLTGAGQFTLVALPFVIAAIAIGLFTVGLLGRTMGLSRQLSGLIAVGTSICGCTAIVATAPLIQAKESEVSYAVACITVFGLAAMFIYPVLAHQVFATQPELAGLFLGTSIHETAQVAGAGMMYEAQYNAPVALDIAEDGVDQALEPRHAEEVAALHGRVYRSVGRDAVEFQKLVGAKPQQESPGPAPIEAERGAAERAEAEAPNHPVIALVEEPTPVPRAQLFAELNEVASQAAAVTPEPEQEPEPEPEAEAPAVPSWASDVDRAAVMRELSSLGGFFDDQPDEPAPTPGPTPRSAPRPGGKDAGKGKAKKKGLFGR